MVFIYLFTYYLMQWKVGDNLQQIEDKPAKTKFKHNLNKTKFNLSSSTCKSKMSVYVYHLMAQNYSE